MRVKPLGHRHVDAPGLRACHDHVQTGRQSQPAFLKRVNSEMQTMAITVSTAGYP